MNDYRLPLFLSLLGLTLTTLTQGWPPPGVPVDTGYTLENEWIKHSKKYPFIAKATWSPSPDSVSCLYNQVYDTLSGRPLHLDLFLPKHRRHQCPPVVAMIHGGGWRSGNKEMNHYMAGELAKRGYAAISIEYRLSMEAQYPAGLQDVKTALRWIRAHRSTFGWDDQRIALMGCSSGGQMAALLGARNQPFPPYQTAAYPDASDTIQAVIDVDGVLAFIHPASSEGADMPGKPSAATRWFGVGVTEDPTLWQEASAINHLHAGSAPMVFINSALPRFSAGQTETMATLTALGIQNQAYRLDESPHSFWLFHPWVDSTLTWINDFLASLWPPLQHPAH